MSSGNSDGIAPTQISRCEVFRTIAAKPYYEWPAYASTLLYDRSSLSGLEEDVRTVAKVWFEHDAHESVEGFVCCLPLAYIEFEAHDRYTGTTRYGMEQLVRAFLLKELLGWEHESALVKYLQWRSSVRKYLDFESVPDQSTLWRTWHRRFTTDLRETIATAARTILIQADRANVPVPREPPERPSLREQPDTPSPTQQTILNQATAITEQVSEIAHPAFSLDRREGCEIHANAFWELQTYLGLRENLAANEGARSFLYESTRDRTPLGHNHRAHLRDLSISEIREMYREAIGRIINRLGETDAFHRAGLVAIDTTEEDSFTGNREGHEDEILGRRRKTTSTPISGRRCSWSVTQSRWYWMLSRSRRETAAKRSSRICSTVPRTSFMSRSADGSRVRQPAPARIHL